MICYQQLAGRAAAAIHGRFEALFDGKPTAGAVLATPIDDLRGAGLSGAKAASIRDLAEKVEDGSVELDHGRLPDDEDWSASSRSCGASASGRRTCS